MVGMVLASMAQTMVSFILFYGCMNAIGCGIQYMVPLVCCFEYFPHQKGLITGIIVGAYGMGSFVFDPLTSYIVNPEGKPGSIKDGDIAYFSPKIANRVTFDYMAGSNDAADSGSDLVSADSGSDLPNQAETRDRGGRGARENFVAER